MIYEKVLFVQNTVSKNMEKWTFFEVQKFHTCGSNINIVISMLSQICIYILLRGGKETISQDIEFLPTDNFLDKILDKFMNSKIVN